MERRRFIKYITILPAVSWAGCPNRRVSPPRSCARDPQAQTPTRLLNPTQWETMKAACARIIPTDGDPGATEARVVNFIDAQLAFPPISSFQQEIWAGLRLMDILAQRRGASRFLDLPPDKQDDVLGQMHRGMRMGKRYHSHRFFRVFLTLTLEGFLCHPIYGGNHDKVGWKFIAFEPRPPHPRCPYRSGG